MHVVKRMITPNGKLDKRTVSAMIVVEIAIFAAVWVTSPFVFLPKPQDVLSAMGDLWQQGLALELITSLTLNFQALLVASLLSLVMAYLGTVPLFRPVIQMIGKLRFLSMVGLTFFFTLMTNSGHQLKLSLLVFSVSVFFVTGCCRRSLMNRIVQQPRIRSSLTWTSSGCSIRKISILVSFLAVSASGLPFSK
jgi:NitT/TauT family transport system permease protein